MELVRNILLWGESEASLNGDNIFVTNGLTFEGYSKEEIHYNVNLMIEAGLLVGKRHPVLTVIKDVTWVGHETLANIRDQGVWNETKKRMQDLPSAALSVLVEIAKSEVKKHLHLP